MESTADCQAEPPGNEQILDLGCGDGVLTARLAELVPRGRVVGVDASPGMIDVAEFRAMGNVSRLQAQVAVDMTKYFVISSSLNDDTLRHTDCPPSPTEREPRMMKKRKGALPQPTGAELRILLVLWTQGPASVREVHHALSDERDTRYSTTLKMLQVMHEKGLVIRDESTRPQVYRAAKSRQATQKQLVDDLVHRAFGGEAGKLLVQALSSKRVSADELAEIKQLIHRLEKEST